MKFVALIDLTKDKPEERIVTFIHDDPGPLPPVIHPEGEDEPKDTEPPKPEPKPS